MNDDDLLKAVQERAADEWSPAELDALKRRLPTSPELQAALRDRLAFETGLHAALGEPLVDVAAILTKAAATPAAVVNRRRHWWIWPLVVSVPLFGWAGWTAWGPRAAPVPRPTDASLVGDPPSNDAAHADESSARRGSSPQSLDPAAAANAVASIDGAEGTSNISRNAESGETPRDSSIATLPAASPDDPWFAGLQPAASVFTPGDASWNVDWKPLGHDEFPKAVSAKWFGGVDGHAFQLHEENQGHRRITRLEGLARLRAPVAQGTTLRWTQYDVGTLGLTIWNGWQGVELRRYVHRQPLLWAAYRVTRQQNEPRGGQHELLQTDDGRAAPWPSGTYDLAAQAGRLILARGGIPLIDVPFPGTPDELFFDGNVRLRGMSLVKSTPFPLPVDERPSLLSSARPADWDWRLGKPEMGQLTKLDDGGVSLSSESRNEWVYAYITLPQLGPMELQVRVANADLGAGWYWGDESGKPIGLIGHFHENRSSRRTFGFLRPGEARDTADHDPNAHPVPFHSSGVWQRAMQGPGVVQIGVSANGASWGRIADTNIRDVVGRPRTLGLFLMPGKPRSITVSHGAAKELTAITHQAEPELLRRVPDPAGAAVREYAGWFQQMFDSCPPDVEADDWLAAAAVGSLRGGVSHDLGHRLTMVLLERVESRPMTERVAMWKELSQLGQYWDADAAKDLCQQLAGWFQEAVIRNDPHAELPLVALRESPPWTHADQSAVVDDAWADALQRALSARDVQESRRLAGSLRFWRNAPHPEHRRHEFVSTRIEQLIAWGLPGQYESLLQDWQKSAGLSWQRHPWTPSFGKDGYNLMADLRSALASQGFAEAERLLGDATGDVVEQLAPASDDWLASLEVLMESSLKQHPEFARRQHAAGAEAMAVRMKRLVAEGDADAIRRATLQYCGTAAAAEAHLWLGDRAAAVGDLLEAGRHYRIAAATDSTREAELASRLMLAGVAHTASSGEALRIGEFPLQPHELALSGIPSIPSQRLGVELPETWRIPTSLTATQKLTFDPQTGQHAEKGEYKQVDWAGRQIGVAVHQGRVYLTNRFQISAFDLTTGAHQWSQNVGGEQGEAHHFSFQPMRPVIVGDMVLARRLLQKTIDLAAFRLAGGEPVWQWRTEFDALTDPVATVGGLQLLTSGPMDGGNRQIDLTTLDWNDGSVRSMKPLLRLRDAGRDALAADWTPTGAGYVFTISGVSGCCSETGAVHWMRKHLWQPPQTDGSRYDAMASRLHVVDDRVYVAPHGSASVSALNLKTGELLWDSPQPDLAGVLGVSRGRVLLSAREGFRAIDAESGRLAWHAPTSERLDGWAFVGDRLITSRRERWDRQRSRPMLVWRDLEHGQVLGETLLDLAMEGNDDSAYLSTFFLEDGRLFALAGRNWRHSKRDLVELAPGGDGPVSFGDPAVARWLFEQPKQAASEIDRLLGDWRYSGRRGDYVKWKADDTRGEKGVFITKSQDDVASRWIQRIALPAGKPSTLALRVGCPAGQKWQLRVIVNQTEMHREPIDDASAPSGWKDVSVDLSAYAGRTVWISVVQDRAEKRNSDAYWKRLSVVRPEPTR